MVEIISSEVASSKVKDGMTIMTGGFLGIGEPICLLDSLAKDNTKNLTLIAVVGAYPGGGFGVGKLVANKQVNKLITSHIGTDPELVRQFLSGELDVEFNPMGTWVERIRAGGGGLGGILTPTGLGTEVEEGIRKIEVDGKEFLLFTPLKADVSFVKAYKADKAGNLMYDGTSINSNQVIATASKIVIAEVDEIVEVGDIPYNQVGTPGLFVDYIVKGQSSEERKKLITDLWVKSGRLK